jgi:hypothetical protein
VAPVILLLLVLLVIAGIIVLNKAEDSTQLEIIDWTRPDEDIEAVVEEAKLLE